MFIRFGYAVLLMLALSQGNLLQGQIFYDQMAAFQEAKKKHLPVLLAFTGSDWCRTCKRFEKNVLHDHVFTTYALNHIVVLIADFPQHSHISPERKAQNEKLADQFNPKGEFPSFLLLTENGIIMNEITYVNEDAETFVAMIAKTIAEQTAMREYKKRVNLMGSFFEFILVDSAIRETNAWKLIDEATEEVSRIEHLISEWIDTSQVSLLNKAAGKHPVKISAELYDLIKRSIAFGDLTQGAFDISFLPLMKLWKFNGQQHALTDSSVVKKTVGLVGYSKIQLLDDNFAYLPDSGMMLGFGAIGQGYAVDRVAKLLSDRNINNFLINSSGDVYARGKRADGTPWKIGIADPFNKTEIIRWLTAENVSVVTSGNYEKFFEHNGVRYAHILDPKSGYPTHNIVSVTVVSPLTEISDALATAIFVLGVDAGLHLAEQLPSTHCIIVDKNHTIHCTKGVEEL